MDPFTALGLDARITSTLSDLGYEEPTAIQRQAIPVLLEGRDVLGQAATGTGKTAAFALPLVQRLFVEERGGRGAAPRVLVLVPTRELAMQVAEAVFRYGKALGVRVLPIYGGQAIERQLGRLRQGVEVVVATPGRAVDLLERAALDLSKVEAVVLDEADEMLDMGFAEDLEAILDAAPAELQTALFSATLPPKIAAIARKHLKDPVRILIQRKVDAGAPGVRQVAYVVSRAHKVASLVRVLDVERPPSALVFCRRRVDVEQLTEALNLRGYQAEALHGGLSQDQRDRVMRRFRSGAAELLVATDVAARGLDVPHLSHVINYEIPASPEDYVHRIGRTARAGRGGVAVTLVEPREHRLLRAFEAATRATIETTGVPTVADLRSRQLELTRASVREAVVAGGLDRFRVIVDALSEELDIVDIALGAIKLANAALGGEREEEELPAPRVEPRGKKAPAGPRPGKKPRGPRVPRGGAGRGGAYLHVGAGRQEGIRPADLVGAIANETGLGAREIGSIEIAEHHSLVELPAEAADWVAKAMQRVALRGQRVAVRVGRGGPPSRPPRALPSRPRRPFAGGAPSQRDGEKKPPKQRDDRKKPKGRDDRKKKAPKGRDDKKKPGEKRKKQQKR